MMNSSGYYLDLFAATGIRHYGRSVMHACNSRNAGELGQNRNLRGNQITDRCEVQKDNYVLN